MDFKNFERGKNEFEFELPTSKRKITFKLADGHIEKKIESELKAREKISKIQSTELTTRLKHIITSVDGNSEISYINNFVDNEFLSRDSLEFRKYLNSITPDIDMNATAIDSEGKETKVVIPITVRFFWPSSNL
jgi:hypothetical protein